jgi:UDP-N-acetylglucosamine 4-epimerase
LNDGAKEGCMREARTPGRPDDTGGTEPLDLLARRLSARPRRWLVTGAAGFIGSHLTQTLLQAGQEVVGLDDLSTGFRGNLESALAAAPSAARRRFRSIEGDVRDPAACRAAVQGCTYVLHHAALGSVPRSLAAPLETNAINVDGFVNVLTAARDAGAERVVYASSSAVYGDDDAPEKREAATGRPLSPYAVSKAVDELYGQVFADCYGFGSVGLRYFNVFGPRQDPAGPYAAVIPKWVSEMLRGQRPTIHGDGETTRDFCHVANVVQANVLAALDGPGPGRHAVYNVGVGERTSLNALFDALAEALREVGVAPPDAPLYDDFRPGDIRHSLADVGKARRDLGYRPSHGLRRGLKVAMPAYVAQLSGRAAAE